MADNERQHAAYTQLFINVTLSAETEFASVVYSFLMNCQSTVARNGVASADAAYDTMADHCTVGQERQGKEETTGDVCGHV